LRCPFDIFSYTVISAVPPMKMSKTVK
jgi:hypothetical protein